MSPSVSLETDSETQPLNPSTRTMCSGFIKLCNDKPQKVYHAFTGFLEVFLCAFLLSTLIGDGVRIRKGGPESPPRRTAYKLDSEPVYVMSLILYFCLVSVRIFIKVWLPNQGDKSNRDLFRYVVKAVASLRSVLLVSMVGLQRDHRRFYAAPFLILLDSCSNGWNKTVKQKKSTIIAFLGAWYPECVYMLSNPSRYGLKQSNKLNPDETVNIAMCYLLTCMFSTVFQSSISFYTGVVLFVIWAITGRSQIVAGAFSGLDDGQAFNLIVLWHITASYVLTSLAIGTYGALKFSFKFIINLKFPQKFCCPLSRNLKYGKKVFYKGLKGIPIFEDTSTILNEMNKLDYHENAEKIVPEETTGCNRVYRILYQQQVNNSWFQSKGVEMVVTRNKNLTHYDATILNTFERKKLKCIDEVDTSRLIFCFINSVPLVNEFNDLEAIYFGHCLSLEKSVHLLKDYVYQEMDKSVVTGTWEINGNKYEMSCPVGKDLRKQFNFYKLLVISKFVLGSACSSLCNLIHLGANEKTIRSLVGNKKSKIFYNSYKRIYGIKTSFVFHPKVESLLNDLVKAKVKVEDSFTCLILTDCDEREKITVKNLVEVKRVDDSDAQVNVGQEKEIEEQKPEQVPTIGDVFDYWKKQLLDSKNEEDKIDYSKDNSIVELSKQQISDAVDIYFPDGENFQSLEKIEKGKMFKDKLRGKLMTASLNKRIEMNKMLRIVSSVKDNPLIFALINKYKMKEGLAEEGKDLFSLNWDRWFIENDRKYLKKLESSLEYSVDSVDSIFKSFDKDVIVKAGYVPIGRNSKHCYDIEREISSRINLLMEDVSEKVLKKKEGEEGVVKIKEQIEQGESSTIGENSVKAVEGENRFKEESINHFYKMDLKSIDLKSEFLTKKKKRDGNFCGFGGKRKGKIKNKNFVSQSINFRSFLKSCNVNDVIKPKRDVILSKINGNSVKIVNDNFNIKINKQLKLVKRIFYKKMFELRGGGTNKGKEDRQRAKSISDYKIDEIDFKDAKKNWNKILEMCAYMERIMESM